MQHRPRPCQTHSTWRSLCSVAHCLPGGTTSRCHVLGAPAAAHPPAQLHSSHPPPPTSKNTHTTAQPSSSRTCMSKWLVGSSSSRMCGLLSAMDVNTTRACRQGGQEHALSGTAQPGRVGRTGQGHAAAQQHMGCTLHTFCPPDSLVMGCRWWWPDRPNRPSIARISVALKPAAGFFSSRFSSGAPCSVS